MADYIAIGAAFIVSIGIMLAAIWVTERGNGREE